MAQSSQSLQSSQPLQSSQFSLSSQSSLSLQSSLLSQSLQSSQSLASLMVICLRDMSCQPPRTRKPGADLQVQESTLPGTVTRLLQRFQPPLLHLPVQPSASLRVICLTDMPC